MTRILYWNIEKFAKNKIDNDDGQNFERGTTITKQDASAARLDYIIEHFGNANNRPDLFVVVEVQTGYDGPGYLVRGSGAQGAADLLAEIRTQTNNDHWMLVPPLQTGRREAVAIYYDSSNYAFTGPRAWGGGNGPDVDSDTEMQQDEPKYPAPFADALPDRVVPDGLPNAGKNEQTLAAGVEFTYAANTMLGTAGNAVGFDRRAPYWATFAEVDFTPDPPDVRRQISIFAIHAPAAVNLAQDFLTLLGGIAEIVDNIGDNEVRVVVGDFNVNLLNNDGTLTKNVAYNALPNFALGIDRLGDAPDPVAAYIGYFATHIRPSGNATYWTTEKRTDYYPGYGCPGSEQIRNFFAIDNIFVQYGAHAPGQLDNVTIMSGISGAPFEDYPPLDHTNPGHYPFDPAMVDFMVPPDTAAQFEIAIRSRFVSWNNYRRVRSTSDHLAIMADI